MSVFLAAVLAWSAVGQLVQSSEQSLAKAVQLFGEPLSEEHQVYRLNDNYVVWLIYDRRSELFEVDAGPKSYYSTEFPSANKSPELDRLSEIQYEDSLQKISQLKDVGELQERHSGPVPSAVGPLNTDRFSNAFVDRVVTDDSKQDVRKFDIYFLQDMEGSPVQIETVQGLPMVCLADVWYYVPPKDENKIELGRWQTLHVAGPSLREMKICHRTTVLRDADGFTIAEPQNGTIEMTEPFRVRGLAGRVAIGDQPLAGVNVEVRRGSENVLASTTDAGGNFRIPESTEGEYKFKVTKDGFKALSGTIIVDHNAQAKTISFEMHVGT